MKEFKGSNIIFPVEYAGFIDMQEKPVYGHSNVLYFECVGEETAKANAQLFATSPELLEAAQKALAYIDKMLSPDNGVTYWSFDNDAHLALRSAIDKAINY